MKICDFGLARPVITDLGKKKNILTEYIATRWYRPPEVLLSWCKYKKSVDLWSVGCIFAEMLGRKPLFPGEDSKILNLLLYLVSHQLELIFNVIGTPPIEEIYQISHSSSTEMVVKIGQKEPIDLNKLFPNSSNDALNLLSKMLKFDPSKRITVEDALEHPYLADLHLPEDEPESDEVTTFDFEYEEYDDITIEELKELIKEEILLYHDNDCYQKYILDKKQFIIDQKKLIDEKIQKQMNNVRRKSVKYIIFTLFLE